MDPLVDALKAAQRAADSIPADRWEAAARGLMRKVARDHPVAEVRNLAGEVAADMDREAGCLCQDCGHRYRVDVVVPDALWELIKPAGKPRGGGLLCGLCIMAKIEAQGAFASFRLEAT